MRLRILSPEGRAPAARDVLAAVLRYIIATSQAKPATLRDLLGRQIGREEADKMLTAADMLRREGEARGVKKGEARGVKKGELLGKREALLGLLRQRFGRLPAAAVARVDRARTAQLDAWFGRVLTASSLDEVLGTKAAGPPGEAARPARTGHDGAASGPKPRAPARARARGAQQRTRG
jgi:hypothetical protein